MTKQELALFKELQEAVTYSCQGQNGIAERKCKEVANKIVEMQRSPRQKPYSGDSQYREDQGMFQAKPGR